MTAANLPILIAGAGIGGLTTGICLQNAGFDVQVLEKFDAVKEVGAGILLGPNASGVLYKRGLGEALDAVSAPMSHMKICSWRGKVFVEQPAMIDNVPGPSRMIHRAALQRVLYDALGHDRVQLGTACTGFTAATSPAEPAVFVNVHQKPPIAGRALIGADGVHSAIRQQIIGDTPLRYHGYTCWRGITEPFQHPDFEFGTLMEMQGPGTRIGVSYIDAERIYWWATANSPQGLHDDPNTIHAHLHQLFADWPDLFHALVDSTPADKILRNDIQDRAPTRNWSNGAVTLLGDAAHPMAPNLGQGACSAIEDAAVLTRCLVQNDDPQQAFLAYEKARQPRTERLQKLSKQFGDLAQWQNPTAVWLRELTMSMAPKSAMERQQRWIWGFDAH